MTRRTGFVTTTRSCRSGWSGAWPTTRVARFTRSVRAEEDGRYRVDALDALTAACSTSACRRIRFALSSENSSRPADAERK